MVVVVVVVFWGEEEALDDIPEKDERGPLLINQTNIGTVSKTMLGKPVRDEGSAYWFLRAHRYDLELNCTE